MMFKDKRRTFAWILLILSIVGWPLTALTIFKDEPQGVLGLSWLAIILTNADILFTAEIKED